MVLTADNFNTLFTAFARPLTSEEQAKFAHEYGRYMRVLQDTYGHEHVLTGVRWESDKVYIHVTQESPLVTRIARIPLTSNSELNHRFLAEVIMYLPQILAEAEINPTTGVAFADVYCADAAPHNTPVH